MEKAKKIQQIKENIKSSLRQVSSDTKQNCSVGRVYPKPDKIHNEIQGMFKNLSYGYS